MAWSGVPVHGQPQSPYVATHWTIDDGLPVNTVNDVTQTDDGYLWLATYDGLVRFDGIDFTVYRSGDYEGFPSSRITDLHAFGDGLWFFTESGHLVRFKDAQFRVLNSPERYGRTVAIHKAPDGTPWIGTEKGAFRYVDGRFERFAPETLSAQVESFLHARDGSLWVGTRTQGIYRRLPDGRWSRPSIDVSPGRQGVYRLIEDPSGSVWIGQYPNVLRWRDGTFEAFPYQGPKPASLYGLIPVDGARPLLGTSNGMYRFQDGQWVRIDALGEIKRSRSFYAMRTSRVHDLLNTGNALYRLESGYERIYRTQDAVIESAFQDKEGNLWLGTNTAGLIRLQRSPVTVFGTPEGLPGDNIYPVEQDADGRIWIGTLGGGLAVYQDGTFQSVVPRQGNQPLTNIWALHDGPSGFWVGGARLCRFDAGRCYGSIPPLPRLTRIRAIHEDRSGRLWVGAESGLYRQPDASDPTAPWEIFTPQNSALPHQFVRVIRETADGALWFGTNGGGIARYVDGAFVSLTKDEGLPSNLVREIHRDSSGVYWIGTEDNGLARVALPDHAPDSASVRAALARASTTHISTDDGLFDDVIHRIIERDGRMWMSTNRGLFWVRKRQLNAFAQGERAGVQSVSYTTRSGMRSREANGGMQPAGIEAEDGRLWFPTQQGVVVIDPDEVYRGTGTAPPVRIERLVVDGRPIRPDTAAALTLPPGVEEISIDYTALDYSDPQNVRFRYRLDGLRSGWSQAGARRTAYFTNLAPGEHRFAVSARRASSAWSTTPASLTFRVEPHFYQTAWFYAMCVLLFVLGGYGFIRYRIHAHRRRADQLDRIVAERTQQLREEQQALRESEARFRAMFEDAAPGIAVLDQEQQVLAVNPALERILGSNASQVLGTRFDALLMPDATFEDVDDFGAVLAGRRQSVLREYRFQGADGTAVWGQTSVSRLPAQGDRGDRLLVFVVDVTRRKQLEERLRQSQRLETVGTLTGGIAHEFNNVLHTARAYLEMALDAPDASSWTFVERASSNLERASDLVEQLLTFTQQEAKTLEERVDVGAVVRDAVDLTRPALPDNVTARVDTADGAIIRGDGSKIQQVAVNLVTNAGQAMGGQNDPAVLDVSVRRVSVDADLSSLHVDLAEGSYVCLTVSDTGPGMNEEMQKTIFDPFFSTKDVGKGTGLGLAVVHGIVSAHDGTVVVHSREGLGTSFVVYLPACSDPEVDPDASTDAQALSFSPPPTNGSSRKRVLLVDGNAPRRAATRSRLRRLGCTVTACGDADAARSALADAPSGSIDLVITGFDLPDTDGLAFTRSLRGQGYEGALVIASVYGAHVTEDNVRATGADAVLHRPIDHHDWSHLVRTLSRREEA